MATSAECQETHTRLIGCRSMSKLNRTLSKFELSVSGGRNFRRSTKASRLRGAPRGNQVQQGVSFIMFLFDSFFGTLISLIILILDIIAISNVLRSRHDNFTKAVLILLILFIPFIGAGVYLLIFRDKGY